MRGAVVLGLVLGGFTTASLALAQPAEGAGAAADWDGAYDDRNERRSDLALGVALGVQTGTVSGTRNETLLLEDESAQRSTGAGFGNQLSLLLGGAIEDWFTVGIGASLGGMQGQGLLVGEQSFHLRFELYPLYSLGHGFRDLGLATDFGLGLLTAVDTEAEDAIVIEGGSLSSIGVGAFYEGVRFARRFGSGPSLHYRNLHSLSATSHAIVLGYRLTFYSGPRRDPAAAVARARF